VASWMVIKQGPSFRFKPHIIDSLFGGFLVIILISLAFHGLGGKEIALFHMLIFMVLPYTLGRLLSVDNSLLMIKAGVVASLVALPIIALETFLFSDAAYNDRVTLFGGYWVSGSAGLLLGSFAVLIVCYLLSPEYRRLNKLSHASILTLLAFALWLTTYIAGRAGVLAAILVGLGTVLFTKWATTSYRLFIAAFLLTTFAVSYTTLPSSRAHLYDQIVSVAIWSLLYVKPGKLTVLSCKIKGDSASQRIIMYREALDLFRMNPLTGVGAGNFSAHSKCYNGTFLGFPHSTLLQAFSELGAVGGGVFAATILLALLGLSKIIFSEENTSLRKTAWLLGPLWVFYFIVDQYSGNYFTGLPFYLLTGVVAALLSSQQSYFVEASALK